MEGLNPSIYEFIISKVPKEQVFLNEPMSGHTTFRVGGNADAYVKVSNEEQLIELIKCFNRVELPYFVIGNGSNIVVSDRGYRGVIIELSGDFKTVEISGNNIKAYAGALMSMVAKKAMEHGLSGMEFASGIPGTIGGGVVMNAGAYGGELKDIVTKVNVLTKEGEIICLNNQSMEFGYRTSAIKNRAYVVLSVCISLSEGNIDDIKAQMDELNKQRCAKQPLEYPSAGSTFKRPDGYFAGKLIMEAGLRGFTYGGAAVSEKHCGFVINKGNACAADIYEIVLEIQDRVKSKFNVLLEPEIMFLGDF